jgi:hypothetical protein
LLGATDTLSSNLSELYRRRYRSDKNGRTWRLDIGIAEKRRFEAELTGAIKDALAKEPELRRDSPVYKFLENLTPPSIQQQTAAGGPAPGSAAGHSGAAAQPASADNDGLQRDDAPGGRGAEEGQARRLAQGENAAGGNAWVEAKIAARPEEQQTAKLEDPYILQRLALATYKSQYPSAEEALMEARDFLSLLEPHTSNDTETLDLWASVHKQLWPLTN